MDDEQEGTWYTGVIQYDFRVPHRHRSDMASDHVEFDACFILPDNSLHFIVCKVNRVIDDVAFDLLLYCEGNIVLDSVSLYDCCFVGKKVREIQCC